MNEGEVVLLKEWLNSPLILVVAGSIVSFIFFVGRWVGGVNADRVEFKRSLDEIRKNIEEINKKLERRTDEQVIQALSKISGGNEP